jgi:hypothetical protein
VSITLNFSFFNTEPDTVQTVSIDECLDITCSDATPLYGSPYRFLAESLYSDSEDLPLVATGFARVTYTSVWSGHTQARFVLSYTSDSKTVGVQVCNGLRPNTWHHVAAVIEIVSDTVLARLYVNGSLVAATNTAKAVGSGLMLAGGGGVALGRAHPMSAPFGHFSGLVDELSVLNRSLSEGELASAMMIPCRNRSDTVLCFSFDRDTSLEAFVDSGGGQQSNAIPVVGDKFLPWCRTSDDGGNLLIQHTGYYATVVPYGPSWGFCTDEIRLPGLGFDYDAPQLSIGKNISNFGALGTLPGCVNLPLVVQGNVARRYVPPSC